MTFLLPPGIKGLTVPFYRAHPGDCFCHSQNIFLYNPRPLYDKCVTSGTGDARLSPFPPITKVLQVKCNFLKY